MKLADYGLRLGHLTELKRLFERATIVRLADPSAGEFGIGKLLRRSSGLSEMPRAKDLFVSEYA